MMVLLLVIFLMACSSGQRPNKMSHVYMTNTQQSHKITGIQFKYNNRSVLLPGVREISKVGYFPAELHIDGREAWSQHSISEYSSFIQLPPGEHHLYFKWEDKTLGPFSGGGLTEHEAIFELATGQIGVVECWSGYDYGPGHMCDEVNRKKTGGVRAVCIDYDKKIRWNTCYLQTDSFKDVKESMTERCDKAEKSYNRMQELQ